MPFTHSSVTTILRLGTGVVQHSSTLLPEALQVILPDRTFVSQNGPGGLIDILVHLHVRVQSIVTPGGGLHAAWRWVAAKTSEATRRGRILRVRIMAGLMAGLMEMGVRGGF